MYVVALLRQHLCSPSQHDKLTIGWRRQNPHRHVGCRLPTRGLQTNGNTDFFQNQRARAVKPRIMKPSQARSKTLRRSLRRNQGNASWRKEDTE
ncbi:hypothetical protein CONPUDRAFT_83935, partial [Coniophora puteana RWD-64-598 SS2]